MPSIIDFMYAGLILAVIAILISNFIMIIIVGVEGVSRIEKYFNPLIIYKNHKVNKFGCIMLTLFYHIAFCIHAIWFWFYKLCTVGRR